MDSTSNYNSNSLNNRVQQMKSQAHEEKKAHPHQHADPQQMSEYDSTDLERQRQKRSKPVFAPRSLGMNKDNLAEAKISIAAQIEKSYSSARNHGQKEFNTPPSNEEIVEAYRVMGIDEEQLDIGNAKRLAPAKLGSARRDSEVRAVSPDKNEQSRSKSPDQKAHQIEALRRNSEASQMMVKRWTTKLS